MAAERTVVCATCGRGFVTRSPRALYCPDRPGCRQKAARRRRQAPSLAAVREPWSVDDALTELDAMLELMPRDLAVLEAYHPDSADPIFDELLGGLATHQAGLEKVRDWLAARREVLS